MAPLASDDPKFIELATQAMEIYWRDVIDIPVIQWLHRIPYNQTYWTNWPTEANPGFGGNGAFWHHTGMLVATTLWWLFLTLGFIAVGAGEDPNYFFGLIWTLSALVVWIGWWHFLRRPRGHRQQLRLVLALLIAEVAALTAPLSLLVVGPIVAVRRRRHRRTAPAASVPADTP